MLALISLTKLPRWLAYLTLFLVVGGESAGVPLPGETSLIAGGVLASKGHLSIYLVIVAAAAGAIVGDNVGYVIGRRGGRWLMSRGGERRQRLLARGEEFFDKHGAKAVFFGRWLPGLRITAAWLAGIHKMQWRRFAFWNAAGGIGWAISVGLAAYLLGQAAATAFKTVGLIGAGIVVLVIAGLLAWRWIRTRSRNRG
ncbi:MAG: DedA family protein [Thermoleophilia bacterium]